MLAERYAARAVQLLREAAAEDPHAWAARAARAPNDPDLAPLRPREELTALHRAVKQQPR